MTEKIQGAQSFARSMSVLQQIADASSPPGIAELLADGTLTRPTLYRILSSLEAENLIWRSGDKRYRLSTRLITLAHRALAQQDVRSIARDALLWLRDQTGETVHLAVRVDSRMVYIDKIESEQTVRMASSVGTSVAMHSSSVGRAWLSALPSGERETVIDSLELTSFTPQTITQPRVLKDVAKQGQRHHYCVENEENEGGIVCFGAAVLDEAQRPIAAVSVSIPTFRIAADEATYAGPLVLCCERISSLKGWPGRASCA